MQILTDLYGTQSRSIASNVLHNAHASKSKRQSSRPFLTLSRTQLLTYLLTYCGPAAWNCLPAYLQAIADTNIFKRHLESFLFTDSFL